MKLICKCGECLTKDMFLSKDWTLIDEYYEDCDEEFPEILVQKFEKLNGSFEIRSMPFDNTKYFCINKDSVLPGILPEFKPGMGCCDIHIIFNCPKCKTDLGIASLDCYDDKCIDIKVDKVNRCYNYKDKSFLKDFHLHLKEMGL